MLNCQFKQSNNRSLDVKNIQKMDRVLCKCLLMAHDTLVAEGGYTVVQQALERWLHTCWHVAWRHISLVLYAALSTSAQLFAFL